MKLHIQQLLAHYRDNLDITFSNAPDSIIQSLAENQGIKCKYYPLAKVILLDYDQIDAPKSHPITIECRSLILDSTTYEVLSRKFDRFFNYGEMLDYYEDFSFDGSTVFEKADGSLIGLWYSPHTDRFEISTRGTAFAEADHPMGGTFRERVLTAFGFKSEFEFQRCAALMVPTRPSTTFVFEYCSPENRIVTPYKTDAMVLLGVTKANGESLSVDYEAFVGLFHTLGFQNVRAPLTYQATSLKHAQELAESLPGLQEGFVVYDPKSNKRVKVKSTTYLVAHRLRGNDPVPTRKNMLELVLEGDTAEMLAYFPEFEKYITPVQDEVNAFLDRVCVTWDQVKGIEDQKEFAAAVGRHSGFTILFDARKHSRTPRESWREFKLTAKMKLFS